MSARDPMKALVRKYDAAVVAGGGTSIFKIKGWARDPAPTSRAAPHGLAPRTGGAPSGVAPAVAPTAAGAPSLTEKNDGTRTRP